MIDIFVWLVNGKTTIKITDPEHTELICYSFNKCNNFNVCH